VSLQKCGIYKYSESSDFEILLLGYAMANEPVHIAGKYRKPLPPFGNMGNVYGKILFCELLVVQKKKKTSKHVDLVGNGI